MAKKATTKRTVSRSNAADCSTSESKHVPIKVFLESLKSQKEFNAAADALMNFIHDLARFPKPIAIQGIEMTPTELQRFHDGHDAAVESAVFLAALATGQLNEYVKSRRD